MANDAASLPIAFRLYLPEDWAADSERRRKAGVPDEVISRTTPQIALDQTEAAVLAGVVLADAGYGNDAGFRARLTGWGLPYVVGIQSTTTVWTPGCAPLQTKPYGVKGRPPKLMRREAKLRWRIERDYQDLKQEVGLGHYEGRGWRGFLHHAALAIALTDSSSPDGD